MAEGTPLESGHGRPRRSTACRGRRPRCVAHLARGEPRDCHRSVDGDLAIAFGSGRPRLRGCRRGGALFRLGGQHGRQRRRRSQQALFRPAQAAESLGGDEQGTRRTADPGRADGTGRSCRHRTGEGERLLDGLRHGRAARGPGGPGNRARGAGRGDRATSRPFRRRRARCSWHGSRWHSDPRRARHGSRRSQTRLPGTNEPEARGSR